MLAISNIWFVAGFGFNGLWRFAGPFSKVRKYLFLYWQNESFIYITVPALRQYVEKPEWFTKNTYVIFIKSFLPQDSFQEAAPLICLYTSFYQKKKKIQLNLCLTFQKRMINLCKLSALGPSRSWWSINKFKLQMRKNYEVTCCYEHL